jgi:hypothetical protein
MSGTRSYPAHGRSEAERQLVAVQGDEACCQGFLLSLPPSKEGWHQLEILVHPSLLDWTAHTVASGPPPAWPSSMEDAAVLGWLLIARVQATTPVHETLAKREKKAFMAAE